MILHVFGGQKAWHIKTQIKSDLGKAGNNYEECESHESLNRRLNLGLMSLRCRKDRFASFEIQFCLL